MKNIVIFSVWLKNGRRIPCGSLETAKMLIKRDYAITAIEPDQYHREWYPIDIHNEFFRITKERVLLESDFKSK